MNDSTAKVDWRGISPAEKARKLGYHVTAAASRGFVSMTDAEPYFAPSPEPTPQPAPKPKAKPDVDPLERIDRRGHCTWSVEQDRRIIDLTNAGHSGSEIAAMLNRSRDSVMKRRQRLKALGFI